MSWNFFIRVLCWQSAHSGPNRDVLELFRILCLFHDVILILQFCWPFNLLLRPLKQHSLKNCWIPNFTIYRHLIHGFKIFLDLNVFGDSQVFKVLGSRFKIWITSWKRHKIQNGSKPALLEPEWAGWRKKRNNKFSGNCTFNLHKQHMYLYIYVNQIWTLLERWEWPCIRFFCLHVSTVCIHRIV